MFPVSQNVRKEDVLCVFLFTFTVFKVNLDCILHIHKLVVRKRFIQNDSYHP